MPNDDPPGPADEDEPTPARPLVIVPTAAPRPLMRRPAVVVPLFLLVVGVLIAGVMLSRTDPDELFARAVPLMKSDDPADWERAWSDYLEPLSRDHPDKFADEIKAFRIRTQPVAELRKALAAGRSAKYASEAERLYHVGLDLARAGDFAAAKKHWERTIVAFAGSPSDSLWVEFCRQAAARVSNVEGTLHRPVAASGLRSTLDRAKALKEAGKSNEANAVLDALEALYRDDPDWAEIRAMIRKER